MRYAVVIAILAGCTRPVPRRVATYGPIELRCDHQHGGCRVPPAAVSVVRDTRSVVVSLAAATGYTLPVVPLRCGEHAGECGIVAKQSRGDQATQIELSTPVTEPLQLRLHWVSCNAYRCVIDDGVLTVR